MDNLILQFQKLYDQFKLNNDGSFLFPDVIFIPDDQSLIAYVDNSYPEIFYNIEKANETDHLLYFNERSDHILLRECKTEYDAAFALITVIMRNCSQCNTLLSDAHFRVKQSIELGDIETAQKIVFDIVGKELVSFDKSEYSKISLIRIDDKKYDVFFHDRTICFLSYFNKPDIERGYYIALNYGYELMTFRKLMSIVKPETDFSEFEYLYVTGHDEKIF